MAPVQANTYVSNELANQTNLRRVVNIVDSNLKMSVKSYLKYKPYKAPGASGMREDLSPWWDYIIFENDNSSAKNSKKLVYYRWEAEWETVGSVKQPKMIDGKPVGTRIKQVLFESDDNFDYEFKFFKPNGKNLIGYELTVKNKKNGTVPSQPDIVGTIQPLNVGNVNVDNVIIDFLEANKDDVNCIAFRSGAMNLETTPGEEKRENAIQFVCDISGSMYFLLDKEGTKRRIGYRYDSTNDINEYTIYYGNILYWLERRQKSFYKFTEQEEHQGKGSLYSSTGSLWNIDYDSTSDSFSINENTRIEILRKELRKFFENITKKNSKGEDPISYAGITSFGTISEKSDPLTLMDDSGKNMINSYINKFVPYPVHANGDGKFARSGTNIADGIRRAYHQFVRFKGTPPGKNLDIPLSIVVLTDGQSWHYPTIPFTQDGVLTSEQFTKGKGALDLSYFPEAEKAYYQSIKPELEKYNINIYLIGFSGVDGDKKDCDDIARWIGCEEVVDPATGSPSGKYYYDVSNPSQLEAAFTQIAEKVINPGSVWGAGRPK